MKRIWTNGPKLNEHRGLIELAQEAPGVFRLKLDRGEDWLFTVDRLAHPEEASLPALERVEVVALMTDEATGGRPGKAVITLDDEREGVSIFGGVMIEQRKEG
jgi:hypothetical protein